MRGIAAWWDSTARSEVLDQVVEPVAGEAALDRSRKNGPFQAEAVALRWSSAVTAHRVLSPEEVRQMVAPARKGSFLEHLIWIRYPSGILWRSLCSSAMSSKSKKATNIATVLIDSHHCRMHNIIFCNPIP